MQTNPINLAILVSGSGTTLQNLIDRIAAGQLNAQIKLVIGSRPGLKGVDRAVAAGLRAEVVDRREYVSVSEFSRRVFELIDHAGVDLVCLAGWLCLLDVPSRWAGKVLNIHPALLPDFGGKGMYGHRVHEAVISKGCKTSGCTVHFVDATYDTGPIIVQRTCPVLPQDTPDSLSKRVFEEEKIAYPQVIEMIAAGKVRLEGRQVRILE